MNDKPIGEIELSKSSRLIFTISRWKGREYAHVRKHVATSKYDGPTKSGISMAGDVIVAIIGALQQLKTEVPGPEKRQFSKVAKRDETDIIISIIPPDDLKSLPSVDVREFVDSPSYKGPTKKGVRFPWDKLPQFISILEMQARQLGANEKAQPILFPEARPPWINGTADTEEKSTTTNDAILVQLLPNGPKEFPKNFVKDNISTATVELPVEPITVVQQPDGKYCVKSDFGFYHPVRNGAEGNFIFYSQLRGSKEVQVPKEMIEVFKAIKAYENYLRDLRNALLQAYERKSGHRPMAEHRAKDVFNSFGLPWSE